MMNVHTAGVYSVWGKESAKVLVRADELKADLPTEFPKGIAGVAGSKTTQPGLAQIADPQQARLRRSA